MGSPASPSTPCPAWGHHSLPTHPLNHATTRGQQPPFMQLPKPTERLAGARGDLALALCSRDQPGPATQEEGCLPHCLHASWGELGLKQHITAPRVTIPVQVTQPRAGGDAHRMRDGPHPHLEAERVNRALPYTGGRRERPELELATLQSPRHNPSQQPDLLMPALRGGARHSPTAALHAVHSPAGLRATAAQQT